MTLKEFVDRIDFPRLRKQRALLRALMSTTEHDRQRTELAGLANLLDELCDEAAKEFGEKKVFGESGNDNCLDHVKCPKCGQEARFSIEASTVVDVTDDGTDVCGDVEWSATAWIQCTSCEHGGEMWEFQA
jgi:hypothetical protein